MSATPHNLKDGPLAVRGKQDADGIRGHLVADAHTKGILFDTHDVEIETTGHTTVILGAEQWKPLRDAVDQTLGTTPKAPEPTKPSAHVPHSSSTVIANPYAACCNIEVGRDGDHVKTYCTEDTALNGPRVYLRDEQRRELADKLLSGLKDQATADPPSTNGLPAPSEPQGIYARREFEADDAEESSYCLEFAVADYEVADAERPIELHDGDALSIDDAKKYAANLLAVIADAERKKGITPTVTMDTEPGKLGSVKDLTLTAKDGSQVNVQARWGNGFGVWQRQSASGTYGLGVVLNVDQRRELIEALGGTIGSLPGLPAPTGIVRGSGTTASKQSEMGTWADAIVTPGLKKGDAVVLAPCGYYYRLDSVPALGSYQGGTARLNAEQLRQLAANAIDAASRIENGTTRS